jgi:hypothetical protein
VGEAHGIALEGELSAVWDKKSTNSQGLNCPRERTAPIAFRGWQRHGARPSAEQRYALFSLT